MGLLTLEGVSKIYRVGTFGGQELHAVSGVSFEVGEGEVISVIGESGSGKTTLGRMILRLTPISTGRIVFEGQDVSSFRGRALKDYYRRVQGVFQDPFSSYNPIFKADRVFATIREEFFPRTRQSLWNENIERSLAAVGLNPAHVLHKYPHQLSGGQLQRFLIARALLLDIRFLVADEIISMLDASTRIDVLNLLADLTARGLSILFITHDLSLAHYISERALVLYGGRVVEMGPTGRIADHPLHPYTRMLMTCVPRLDRRWGEAQDLADTRARLGAPSAGCAYFGRCPLAGEDCESRESKLVEVEPGHWAACCRCGEGVQ